MIADAAQLATDALTAEQQAFLQALARVAIYLPRNFDADLGRAEGFSMSEYSVLMDLSEAPGSRLRMGDLAAQTALSPGAVTRIVKVLEAKGLAERQPSALDGRGQDAVLTEVGRLRLDKIRPAHVEGARLRVFDKLAGADLAVCTDVLNRIGQDNSPPK
jgi:DNA-binding MarR family transcriptional regulator